MKRTPKILLGSILLLGALYGAVLLFSSFRPFGLLASLESKVADLGGKAKVAIGLADSTSKEGARSTQTNLASVSYAVHELVPKADGWGGALCRSGWRVIVVDKAGTAVPVAWRLAGDGTRNARTDGNRAVPRQPFRQAV